jgi:hypothetical protein
VPYGQSRYHIFRGELDLALRLDEDLLLLGRQRNNSAGLVLGCLSSGMNLRIRGKLSLARSHLEELLALDDPTLHSSLVNQAGIHPQNNAKSSALDCVQRQHDRRPRLVASELADQEPDAATHVAAG